MATLYNKTFSSYQPCQVVKRQKKKFQRPSLSSSSGYSVLWVGSFFYGAFSVTRLCSVNDRVISEWWWIGKDLVGSDRSLILRYYPGIRLEGLRKTTKILNQDSLSPGRDLNPGPPEYEAGVLTTRPWRSVVPWGRGQRWSLVFSPFNHLTRLVARECFVIW
jgi:hypothetical protein